jgi:hypothetical protein
MSDVNSMMTAYADEAVDYAKQLNLTLDFSENSIRQIEDICALLHNKIPKGFLEKLTKKSPPEEVIVRISKMLGGYIGQVLVNHYGGNWVVENNIMSQDKTVVLNIEGMKTFPIAKVYKRLKNGPEDNVYHYYIAITREFKK